MLASLFAALLLSHVAPQQVAAQQPAAADAPANLELPFNPPICETLTYRLTRTDTRNGGAQTSALDMDLSFRRDGDNYVMTVRYRVPPGLHEASAAVALTLRPISVRIGGDGAILSLDDPEGYWATAEAALAEYLRARPAPAAARGAVDSMIARMRALPENEQLALVTQNFAPILEYAGGTLTPGQPLEVEEQRQTAMGPLTQRHRIWLEGVTEGKARIVSEMRMPPEQLSRGGAELFQSLLPSQSGARFAFTAHLDRTVHQVSIETGLSDRWDFIRTMEIEQDGRRERASGTRSLQRMTSAPGQSPCR